MRQPITLLILFLLPALCHAAHINHQILLEAIGEIESGTNPKKIGKAGELGIYQFTLTVWRQHTRRPFELAKDPIISHNIAENHLLWLERELVRRKIEITAKQLALCWNAGLIGGLNQPSTNSVDYASRVHNLYLNLLASEKRSHN